MSLKILTAPFTVALICILSITSWAANQNQQRKNFLVMKPIAQAFSFEQSTGNAFGEITSRQMSDAEALELSNKGYHIEPDQEVFLFDQKTPSASGHLPTNWALSKIKAFEAHQIAQSQGEGVTVCVVDSGVNKNHPQLSGRIIGGINVTDEGTASDYQDTFQHGTHVSSLIAGGQELGLSGVAPGAKIFAVKTFKKNGGSSLSLIINGIRSCYGKAQIINMSFGGAVQSLALEAVLKEAHERGMTLIAAAGNSATALTQPASSQYVIAVGATDVLDNIAEFSSFGPQLSFVAPGVSIEVLDQNKNTLKLSGTSFSAAYVSGLEALRISNEKLAIQARDLGLQHEQQGQGLIDAFETLK